jgi:SagB-type dehydrogenase family enzyme
MELLERLKYLLAITFGKQEEVNCPWSPVPLMRRTSPSGGSRHPTEGYLLAYEIPGLQAGWYHVQADPCALVMINLLDKEARSILLGEEQTSCMGMIILTSQFKRTMYRYREPRAFRVPHMDVGHMLTTIEWLGEELGISTHCYLHFDESYILCKLHASQLDEGVMAVVTIRSQI